jgi:hypothetical protein
VVFDRLVLVPPALTRSEAGLPEGVGTGTGGGTQYSERKDHGFGREVLKERPRKKVGTQHAQGIVISKGGVGRGRAENTPRGQRGHSGTSNYRAGETRSSRDTGKRPKSKA